MLEIARIPYEDKSVLHNLIQLYRYDSSEFDGHALNSHGLYMYKYLDHQWTDEYRRPLFIRLDGELAGFALVSLGVPQEYMMLSNAPDTNVISDFFIMRKFRRSGYGKQAAFAIFDLFSGAWEVRQTAANVPAHRFWNRVIQEYTNGAYSEAIISGERWTGPVQVFRQQIK
ncbi:GNAT family N-acetyltransferase [Paenibacillus marinisediminis]